MFKESMIQRIATAVDAGARGAVGIQRREEDQVLCMFTQGRMLQVVQLRAIIANETGVVFSASEETLQDRMALLDGKANGEEPKLIVFTGENPNRIIVSSEDATLTGFVWALAARNTREGPVSHGVFIVLKNGHGAMQVDGSPDLIRSWQLCAELLSEVANVQSFR